MVYKDLTEEEFEDIVWGPDYTAITDTNKITGKSRWSYNKEQVFLHIATNKYYKVKWTEAATEYQDQEPYATIAEVEPVEVVITTIEYKEVE